MEPDSRKTCPLDHLPEVPLGDVVGVKWLAVRLTKHATKVLVFAAKGTLHLCLALPVLAQSVDQRSREGYGPTPSSSLWFFEQDGAPQPVNRLLDRGGPEHEVDIGPPQA